MGMFVGLKSTSLKGAIQALNLKTGFTTILHGESEIISAGFDHTAVYRCVNGTRKTHKGHIFTRQPLIQSEAAE